MYTQSKIYVLIATSGTYDKTVKLIRAFDSRAGADDFKTVLDSLNLSSRQEIAIEELTLVSEVPKFPVANPPNITTFVVPNTAKPFATTCENAAE